MVFFFFERRDSIDGVTVLTGSEITIKRSRARVEKEEFALITRLV